MSLVSNASSNEISATMQETHTLHYTDIRLLIFGKKKPVKIKMRNSTTQV